MRPAGCLAVAHRRFDGGKRELERIAQGGRGAHLADIRAKFDKGARHARRNSRNDAMAAHQPRSLGDPDEIIGDRSIDGDHAADIHDEHPRAALGNARQRRLHDVLRTLRVDDADKRQEQDAVPDRADWSAIDLLWFPFPRLKLAVCYVSRDHKAAAKKWWARLGSNQ
jgi:hypothetical protein